MSKHGLLIAEAVLGAMMEWPTLDTHSQIRMQRTAVFSMAKCQIPSPIVCMRPKLHGGRLARAQVTLDLKP